MTQPVVDTRLPDKHAHKEERAAVGGTMTNDDEAFHVYTTIKHRSMSAAPTYKRTSYSSSTYETPSPPTRTTFQEYGQQQY